MNNDLVGYSVQAYANQSYMVENLETYGYLAIVVGAGLLVSGIVSVVLAKRLKK